jgi:hypothetical protein
MPSSHPVLKSLPVKSLASLLILAFTITLLAFGCGTARAAKKPEPVYQDAVLKDFHTEQHGKFCTTSGDTNGTVKANTDSDGDTNGTVTATSSASTSCSPRMVAYYTVVMGEHVFTLTPATSSGKKAAKVGTAMLTFGIGAIVWNAFDKNSALYGVLPGTPIKMRSESGTVYVQVGKRESEYKIVAMQ